MDGAISQHMSPRLNPIHPQCVEYFASTAGRKFTQHVTTSGIHIGLVERDPEAAQVAHGCRHLTREAFE